MYVVILSKFEMCFFLLQLSPQYKLMNSVCECVYVKSHLARCMQYLLYISTSVPSERCLYFVPRHKNTTEWNGMEWNWTRRSALRLLFNVATNEKQP